MNVLWAGNYLSQSGYANTAKLLLPRIAKEHRVEVVPIGGGASNIPSICDGIPMLPLGVDAFGNDIIRDHFEHTHADILITFTDVFVFDPDIMRNLPWYPLVPIDHQPVPPAIIEVLKACRRPIAISKFGFEQLSKVGFKPLYIPLAYDPLIWCPGDMKESRKKLGINEGSFYVSFVGVNDSVPNRKGIPELLTAWSMFSRAHPGTHLHLHTSERGVAKPNGISIDTLMRTLQVDPSTVSMANPYRYRMGYPQSELADLARASDLLILPSRGEGFGLPLIEFQACGCPVAVTDSSTGPELNFSGWLIEGEPDWTWQQAFMVKPGVRSIVDTLEAVYDCTDWRHRSLTAIQQSQFYAVDTVMQGYVRPVLQEIGAELVGLIAKEVA